MSDDFRIFVLCDFCKESKVEVKQHGDLPEDWLAEWIYLLSGHKLQRHMCPDCQKKLPKRK